MTLGPKRSTALYKKIFPVDAVQDTHVKGKGFVFLKFDEQDRGFIMYRHEFTLSVPNKYHDISRHEVEV